MGTTTIRAARAFDGTGELTDVTVAIDDGVIRSVESGPAPRPDDVDIELLGCTLLPGLIDTHTHLVWDASATPQDRVALERPERTVLRAAAHAMQHLRAGSRTGPAQNLRSVVDDLGSGQEARVLGTGARMSLLAATYVNASCANMLDFDDTYKTFLHPGATAIAPAMAVAERLRSSGRDVIAAVAIGYEVQIRVAEAALPSRERLRQVWGFAPWQTLGSSAVAANLLSLDAEATRHALGAAAFNAPVPSIRKIGLEPEDRPFSWVKNNYGWAAMGGLLGGLLARNGFRGTRSVLDGSHGFWVMAGSDRCDFAAMTAGLGQEFRLLATSFKPYTACRWTHSAVDCVRALQRDGVLRVAPLNSSASPPRADCGKRISVTEPSTGWPRG